MKFKFLTLALLMATLSSFTINAQKALVKKPKMAKALKSLSKGASDFIFFEASDTNPYVLTGSLTPVYVPLPFTQQKIHHGDAIKPNSTGTEFLLERGTYLVLFTGTFFANPNGGDEGVFFNIALQLGPNTIYINTDSRIGAGDGLESIGISCIPKVIEVDKPTTLSLVAEATTFDTTVTAMTRSLTIIKL